MPRMHMTFQNDLFAIRTYNREDGQAAKAAGAQWHGPHDNPRFPAANCDACKAGVPFKDWWYFARKFADRAVRLREVADDAALAALEAPAARLEISRATGEGELRGSAAQALLDLPVPAPPGLVYKPYQRAGIAFMRSAEGGALLADEPGLGKTIQTIGLINLDNTIRRSLVVVPASLRINWLRESVKWLVRPTRIHVLGEAKIASNVRPGPHSVTAGPELPDDLCHGGVLVIANYDRVRDPDVLQRLMACSWDLLAADEAHFLKNQKAQRTVAVLGKEERVRDASGSKTTQLTARGLRQVATKFIAMTGTPLPNRPVEMWPILHAVSPRTFPDFMKYAFRYCGAQKVFISPRVGSKWSFDGASNLAELQEVMRSTIMVRRLKSDVLKELPPKIRQIVALPATDYEHLIGAEEELYDDYVDEDGISRLLEEKLATIEAEVDPASDNAYANAAAKLGKMGKVSFEKMSKMREKLALAKLDAVLEICDLRLEEEDKIIVFAHHHSVIEKILAHYNPKPKGGKPKPQEAVAVYGPVDALKRDAAVHAFMTDANVRVFVGSIAAAGVGLTLTAAKTVIFAEVDWVPANIAQAEDRAHRIGQTDVVNVIHVVVEKSLDARMVQLLVEKADVADRALDKPAQLVVPEAGRDMGAERAERDAERVEKKRVEAAKYPPVSPLLRELVQEAMQRLDANNEDRAKEKNDIGFNRLDGEIGGRLANMDDPSPGMIWGVGVKFANKYRRQLGELAVRVAEEAERLRHQLPDARVLEAVHDAHMRAAEVPAEVPAHHLRHASVGYDYIFAPSSSGESVTVSEGGMNTIVLDKAKARSLWKQLLQVGYQPVGASRKSNPFSEGASP